MHCNCGYHFEEFSFSQSGFSNICIKIILVIVSLCRIFKSIKFSITTNNQHSQRHGCVFEIHITFSSDKYFNGNAIHNN